MDGELNGWRMLHFAEDDFRGQILGGATQRPCASLHLLGEPEIGHLASETVIGLISLNNN